MSIINEDFYNSISKELISKVGRLRNFTNHSPSSGVLHEEILKSVLSNFLPSRYSIKTGFIYAKPGVVSMQIDLLIIDESEPASYFFKEGDLVVVHPDAVVCGIEVKTSLRGRKQFEKVTENLSSIKTLAKHRTKKGNIGAYLFAYGGTKLPWKTADEWYKSIQVPNIGHYADSLLILNSVLLVNRIDETGSGFSGHYRIFVENEDSKFHLACLSLFFTSILKYIEMSAGKNSNPFSRALIEGYDLFRSGQVMQYGKGVVQTQ